MADNLALKLLVAGIIGAVVGAAAAERYHFPTGLVYGGFNRPPATTYRTRPAIDPNLGSGRVERLPEYYDDDYRYEPAPRYYYYRPVPKPKPKPAPRTALCWREFEDWNFNTVGHYVPCNPARRHPGGRG